MNKLYKLEAVVLRARDCGNADKLLVIYSREQGKLKVMAHGAAKPASRKRGSVQLFAQSRFLLNRGRELDSISQGEIIEMFSPLRNDLKKIGYASYLVELVDALTPEGEPNPAFFELILTALHLLVSEDPELVARSFEIKAFAMLGYRPSLEHCTHCRSSLPGQLYFSPAAGGVLCKDCRAAYPDARTCSRGVLELLKLFLRWHPARLRQLRIDRPDRDRIRLLMYEFIRYHLERDLKSAAFLRYFPAGDGKAGV
ncbi:DNA repair protein RecO [Pelotomaculum sp. PtaB.Bin117]|uniref:DNA repair protein RecO n=1 Tax=Pelotomaculum sp. PtaB.Bin117 TaxID=1811694 RepID=UPI0009C972B1|nr:DNA repair protein RecO [Pelotomaculum sp. PtaB.Bin117]OPX87077.1 MAG: DNA repair protein RecO [Pelotomaculum sp. PtaB.Bin117]